MCSIWAHSVLMEDRTQDHTAQLEVGCNRGPSQPCWSQEKSIYNDAWECQETWKQTHPKEQDTGQSHRPKRAVWLWERAGSCELQAEQREDS